MVGVLFDPAAVATVTTLWFAIVSRKMAVTLTTSWSIVKCATAIDGISRHWYYTDSDHSTWNTRSIHSLVSVVYSTSCQKPLLWLLPTSRAYLVGSLICSFRFVNQWYEISRALAKSDPCVLLRIRKHLNFIPTVTGFVYSKFTAQLFLQPKHR